MALVAARPLRADDLPGLRGHHHTGTTVPDMQLALDFFLNVPGCRAAMTFGSFSDPKGSFMSDVLHADPAAVVDQISMVRCGAGSNIKLFKYTSPDRTNMTPRNSDIGGMHIALYVDDVQNAKDYFGSKGVKTFKGPISIGEGPAAGETILYFLGSWACNSKPSATRRAWATRRTPARCCGNPPSRPGERSLCQASSGAGPQAAW